MHQLTKCSVHFPSTHVKLAEYSLVSVIRTRISTFCPASFVKLEPPTQLNTVRT